MVALAGCSTADSGKPAASATATETAKPAEKTPAVTIGDAIGAVKDGKPVIITDSRGSYQKMALNPDAAFAKTIPSDNDGTAKQSGFSDADILDGQKWVSEFIVSEAIDSTILDDHDGKRDWIAAHKNILEGDVLAIANASPDELAFLNTQKPTDAVSVTYARDGKPRAKNVTVKLNQVRGLTQGGEAYLLFDGAYDVAYRAKSTDVYAAYEAKGYSKDQVNSTLPDILSKDELPVHGTATFQWALHQVGEAWRIAGEQYTYDNTLT
ncbi:hypothetical protein [Curtobacterium sp. MCBA15_008]|uniref:hypothetical protein n=1 Tax=Curtobacterium sp. MCBA15_008 TaxID=1898736 RepID=UPI0008DE33BB|nr:hypothetical protein [Curtobacterium sp. MCBA15_008]OII09074.1 hypothetical protein BIU96_04025 [Curtobacterium sp. MCBA15_008]